MPAIQTSNATYLNIERGKRELSFLMALRICRFYNLDLHEFISLLSDEELGRNDFSIIRTKERKDKKKATVLKARADKIKEDKSNLS
jgi:transcriptional regulator with XRE-family HTH domain